MHACKPLFACKQHALLLPPLVYHVDVWGVGREQLLTGLAANAGVLCCDYAVSEGDSGLRGVATAVIHMQSTSGGDWDLRLKKQGWYLFGDGLEQVRQVVIFRHPRALSTSVTACQCLSYLVLCHGVNHRPSR